MTTTEEEEETDPKPTPDPCISGRIPSPEFEFGKAHGPLPNILSADELFSGGFLLPLHHLHISDADTSPAAAPQKRCGQIFKKSDVELERRKIGGVGVGAAELNIINIWPFSRSRSAGGRTRTAATGGRKVSSAPCSRSNSTGDGAASGGVHLGRSGRGPVLKLRRGGRRGGNEWEVKNGGAPAKGTRSKVLSLNVPMCMGYRSQMSCGGEEGGAAGGNDVTADGVAGGGGVMRSNLMNIRSLFSRKVY